MAAISSHGGTPSAFAAALSKFKATLKKEELESFSSVTAGASSMEDVRKAATAIQERQLGEDGIMRNVRRIQPLINGLQQFSGVIEVFVQSKPEVLALLWGPVKFLLQIASSYITAYEKLMDAFQKIGENLSRFQEFSIIFKKNPRMQQVIVMIFEEILEFYQLTLKYFRSKYWKKLFISMWSTFEIRFGKILSNLDQHKVLIDSEAAAAHIAHVHAAIRQAQADDEAARLHRDKQDLDLTRKWLAPVNYDAFIAKLGAPCTATGGWFSREDDVKDWLDVANKTSRLLWLTGIPGSGKTFLSSIFLAHTKSTFPKGIPIAYAFPRDNDSNFSDVMRTLVAQLLHHSNPLLRYLDEKRESNPYPPSSEGELQEILEFMLEDIGTTYLFIDGLDEIDIRQREMVLGTICFLLPKAENLRVFLSSRDEVDISDSLKGIAGPIRRVDIGTKNQPDIDTYVTDESKEIFKKFCPDSDMRQEIQNILDRVRRKAEGMFLWARLVMYDLKRQVDMEGLEYAADNLPTGLDEAYGRILNRINEKITERERALAKRVLAWIMYGKRPLSLNELKQAMAISEGDRCINARKRILVRLDELCGPILEFDARDKIRFVHFTVKEYLKSDYSAEFSIISQVDAYRDIAITCITYLSFTCFDIGIEDKMVIDFVRSGEYCLYQYAESYWLDHVKDAIKLGNDNSWVESLVPLLDRLVKLRLDEIPPHRIGNLKPSGEHQFLGKFSRWPEIQRYLLTYHKTTCGNAGSGVTLVDPFGLQMSVKRFRKQLEILFTSESKADKDKLHQYYGENIFKCSQVHCAYYVEGFDTQKKRDEHLSTHTRPVKCSFQGCDFESMGFATPAALKAHIQRYHPIHTYDEEKYNLSYPNSGQPLGISDRTNVLLDSISTRDLEVVKSVLDLDLDLDSVFKGGEPVLHHALKVGSEDIFRLLLEKGADADEIDGRSKETILSSAVSRGSEQRVQLLLDWGADINKVGEGENSVAPLSLAIKVCYNLVKLLLENGADANTAGSGGIPALILAVEAEQTAIAKLLLEYGANVDSKDSKGETALAHATSKSPAILQLLLENGADANGLDSNGKPALVLAARTGQTVAVKLLLEYGAKVDSKDSKGETALIHAASKYASSNSPAIVQILLENGSDANGLDSDGNPALALAAFNGQTETVKLLLEYGANVDAKATEGETALVYAAENGSPAIAKQLLEKGVDANGLDSNGRPALVLAAFNGQTETVKLLLEYGANVDAKATEGETALVYAAANGPPAIVQLLLENGADANRLGSNGDSALVLAASGAEVETVKVLLEYGAKVDSKDSGGETALIHAASKYAYSNSPAIVQLLLEKGADANGLDSNGKPALVLAAMTRQTETVKLLLEYGAKVDSKDSKGETALIHVAGKYSWKYSPAIVQLLLENGADANGLDSDGYSALYMAVLRGRTEIIKLLLEYGANVDSKNSKDKTTLIYAITKKSPAIVQLLLENGADANGLDSNGKPALVLAASNAQTETVKLLLKYGAKIDSKDSKGETALAHAARNSPDIVQLLLEKGADANGLDSNGKPALVLAASNAQTETVKLLLEYGAKVDSQAPGGATALVHAVAERFFAIVQLLLEKGADANGLDSNGKPALVLAASNGQTETVKLLLGYGANVDSKDSNGETALVHAASKSPAIVQLLLEKGADANGLDSNGTPALVLAASNGQTETVKLLLEYGAKVDSKDSKGETALIHVAGKYSWKYSPAIVQLLLEKGADSNGLDSDGKPALVFAASNGQTETVKLLLEYGAKVDSKDSKGETALIHVAGKYSWKYSPAIVQLLLEKGADANGLDSNGKPALVLAASDRGTEAVKLLLGYGANMEWKDQEGKTALEWAAGANLDVFKLLLDKGAESSTSRLLGKAAVSSNEVLEFLLRGGTNISVTDKNEALLLAARHAQEAQIGTLLNYGADVDAQDVEMDSALLILAKSRVRALQKAKPFKVLLKHNANPNITDKDKRTALHYMASQNLKTSTKILLEHGARYDIADKEGKTALTISAPAFSRTILSIAASLKSQPSE